MSYFYIELTDLLCGELNYSFLNRFTCESKSMQGAVSKLSRYVGLNFRKFNGDNLEAIYHSTSKLSGLYIEEYDLNDSDHISCSSHTVKI